MEVHGRAGGRAFPVFGFPQGQKATRTEPCNKKCGELSVFDSSGAKKPHISELLTAQNVYELHSTRTPAVCLSAVSLRKFRMKFKDNTQPFDDSFLLQFLLAEPPYLHKQPPRALLSAETEMLDCTWFPAQVPPVMFSTRSPSPWPLLATRHTSSFIHSLKSLLRFAKAPSSVLPF